MSVPKVQILKIPKGQFILIFIAQKPNI